VWLHEDFVTENRQARARPHILPASDLASKAGARHHSEIAAGSAHHHCASRAQDHQSLAELCRRADIGAGYQQIYLPEKTGDMPMPRPEEMMRDPVQQHAEERWMKVSRRGWPILPGCQEQNEPRMVGSK